MSVYKDEAYLRERIQDDIKNFSNHYKNFQAEAELDLKYYSGNQSQFNSLYSGANDNYNRFVFNLVRRFVELPAGYQMSHRKSSIAVPRENASQQTADQISKVLSWVESTSGFQEILSDAFTYGSLITGLNLIELCIDYSDDPISGDIRFDRLSQNQIIIDPYFKKMDLSDCSSIVKQKYVTPQQAAILLPEYRKEVLEMKGGVKGSDLFPYMPETYNFDSKGLLRHIEYTWMDSRERKIIIDTETNEQTEWVGSDDSLKYIMMDNPQLEIDKQYIPSVKQAIFLEDRLFYLGGNLLGIDEYQYVPALGYYNHDLRDTQFRIQGLVRALRDPQYLFNRRQQISLSTLESRSTSGYIARAGTIVDEDSLFGTGSGQVIWRSEDSKPEDIQPINPPDISPGMAKMTEDMLELPKFISGISDESLGQAGDDIPGILAMLRQGANQMVIQRFFNNIDRTQQICAQRAMRAAQVNFIPEKVQRIIDDQPTNEFYNKAFGKYDVVIEEGLYTQTQKQQAFAQGIQLKELGYNFPELDSFIFDNLQMQDKNKLMEGLEKSLQSQSEQSQQQAQMQMQEHQAGIGMAHAQAGALQGQKEEREAKAMYNLMNVNERDAEAEKDRQEALLNQAKTLKELQDVDLRQMEKLLQIKQMVDAMEETDRANRQSLEQKLAPLKDNVLGMEEPPVPGMQ